MKERLTWGPWTLDKRSIDLVLRDTSGKELYFVPLPNCRNSSQTLDWIAQIEIKQWDERDVGFPKVEILGHFVTALCEILEPQSRLCSGGAPIEVTTPEAAKWASAAWRRLHNNRDESR